MSKVFYIDKPLASFMVLRATGWKSKQPLGKLAKPDEVAELVRLMLSDRGGVMCVSLID